MIQFIADTAAVSLSLAVPFLGSVQPAKSEESLSEWERVFLPIDPGVVLLDISFVPDEPNHGFLLGTRQTLLETKDGGNTWAPRSIASAEDEDFNYRFNAISFKGKEGWIVGKPAILLHTSDAGDTWERIPLSAQLPGDMVYIKATGEKSAEMVTDQGAIYVTSNKGYNWKAAVQETVSATLNRTVSSGISGASYYTGTFNTVNRSPEGKYVAVSSRGNFYLTWEPGQPYWQPHNRSIARRIQNMGWRADGGLWLLVRGGGLFLSKGTGLSEEFEEVPVQSRGFGILDVGYRSQEEAWAAGGSGVLLRTTNGGKTWIRDKAADNIAANLYSVKTEYNTIFFNGRKSGFLQNSTDRSPPKRMHRDLFDSFQSLKYMSPQRLVSPAMSSLQGYYGLKEKNRNSSDSIEMSVYRRGVPNYLEDELFTRVSDPPLSHHHRKSRSLVSGYLDDNGEIADTSISDTKEGESERWSCDKLIRRRQKSEADFSRTPEMMLEDNNIGSSGGFSASRGKHLALRPKAAGRTMATDETGGLNPIPVGLGDSILTEGFTGVRKSSSTPSLQDPDSNGSIRPPSKWSQKSDNQGFSTASLAKPIFDGLPKPITGRRSKAALD
uniref:Photosynthesis system II assembly factor Ycf48/Hcf136-like domain-containing protein n=2 Tax=Cannabis sativa TaxID=3483 RepID=A0A803P0F8_CANSA